METIGSGLLAFLMSDVVGSTAAWESDPTGMANSIALHDRLVENAIGCTRGQIVKSRGEGDSHFIVFANARDAVEAALAIHAELAQANWPGPQLSVRIAVHIGEAVTRAGDYYGPTVNRCARIRAMASAGQVLISDAVYQLLSEAPSEDWTFADLGQHRLKDLLRPERLWMVQHRARVREYEIPRSFSTTPNNLPIQLTEFVGRKQDVEDAEALVRRHRLVTLVGAGGSGKTRLAMQVAAEIADDLADGVWWVDLTPADAGTPLVPLILEALRIAGGSEASPEDALWNWLDGKHCLIILDNCEQVVASVAKLVTDSATRSHSLHFLATSRHTLNAPGEHLYVVPALSFPPRGALVDAESCLRYEAIELLIERARMRDSRFALTDSNAPHLAEICRRLDGLPLAIELAAPKLSFLGAEAMVKRLDDIFRLLHGGGSHTLPRHKTIETAIQWSYDLLTAPEQALFRRLSIFISPWTLDQAEYLAGIPPLEEGAALEVLVSLRDKSLLNLVHGEEGDRQTLLEPIRQFAERKLLESGEADEVGRRLTSWYAAKSRESERLTGAAQSLAWTNLLNQEYDNFRKALNLAIRSNQVDEAYEITFGIHRYWLYRTHYREAQEMVENVLALGPSSADQLNARMLNLHGVVVWYRGLWDQAEHDVTQARDIWLRLDEKEGAVRAYINLGLIAIRQSKADQSRENLQRAIELAEAAQLDTLAASAILNLAGVERDLENYEVSARLLRRALRLADERNVGQNRLTLLGNLASCLLVLGNLREALPFLLQALESSRDAVERDRLAANLSLAALAALRMDEPILALRLARADERIRRDSELSIFPGFEERLRQWVAEGLQTRVRSSSNRDLASVDEALDDAIRWLKSRMA